MTPTWYDLLGVDRDAEPDEVRAAWKRGIADLEPGDRRFETLNRAAKVLLDPAARADYDASLAPEDEPEQGLGLVTGLRPSSTSGGKRPSTVLLAVLGALALAMVLATTLTWARARDAGDDGTGAREAQRAAEEAAVPVLSYDHRHLSEDQERAQALMTGSYREKYDSIFSIVEENAPRLETQVRTSVVASGIVRASEDRVQVLVFVDQPTTNKRKREPFVLKNQVTLTMQNVDGEWLVDDLDTTPVQE